MTKFNAFTSERPLHGGVQRIYGPFENGLSASVVRHSFSYGSDSGLWEMAVLKGGRVWSGYFVGDDVEGYLHEADVELHLEAVSQIILPNSGNNQSPKPTTDNSFGV